MLPFERPAAARRPAAAVLTRTQGVEMARPAEATTPLLSRAFRNAG